MKNSGNFLIILGLLYSFHKLIGTEPNVNGWWLHIGLGMIVYSIGEAVENRARRKRLVEASRKMQDLYDRNEQWRKERGL